MQSGLIAGFLVIVLGLFSSALRDRLRDWFHRAPARIFFLPAALTALFCAVLLHSEAWSTGFVLMAAAYTFAPVAMVYVNRPGRPERPWLDFAAFLMLWLPVEFTAGKELLPAHAWGTVNIAARGAAVTLGLVLFPVFRDLKGVKYELPRRWTDFSYPLAGFAVAAAILIPLGLALSFMGPFQIPEPLRAGAFGLLFVKTLLGVALPEEILFRGLIQNWLMQQFGFTNRTLLVAAVIFGAAHLNNAPGPLPNWRYMILASIAGFIYGKVFWKSSTVLSSAGLHALVNTVRHTFFH
ncbi:MAG TPA: type II CAAX endopeptidase family protein [Bryobacteraceae bacterium]|nr:type II CAAX endopeptidase family protein [Bryobacteraceae bacterium]HOL71871.1 type II CAAX endopeptidase family protein [Bryobacteraceae bacterium]HOQ44544.1 type II CAAX endopeptidase family protein [Bryobacteraceae bacterium]HPQ16041.1 type II CAAX endopeptidase family protein [Bryobacteraceae bacterium]HPU70863.1 type II CAAX endopeptidase family protein [Bryobacteraceae bacterium]